VHLVLFLVLVFGISWQSRPPESVSVELWDAPPAPPVVAPKVDPKPEPKPEPPPEPRPKPPPPPPPKAEPPRKPDIALEKDAKAKKEPPKKQEAKKEPPPKPDPKLDLRFDPREQLAREMQQFEREREKREVLAQMKPTAPPPPASAPAPKGDPTYTNRLIAKIRGNIIMPSNIVGNPEAVFDVEQLPTGEVLSVKLRVSSGNKSLDEAVERAILKSSPLPRPDRESPPRTVEIRYRPLDR
jgi:colicin import membrane protein